MALTRAEKEEAIERLVAKLQEAQGILLSSPQGLNVAALGALRRRLAEAGASHQVVKNTLLGRALEQKGLSLSAGVLKGPVAVSFCQGDVVAVARVLLGFAAEMREFTIKGGILGTREMNEAQVRIITQLPRREVLLAQVLGGMQTPLAGLVGVLKGNLRGLVQVLKARSEQLEKAQA